VLVVKRKIYVASALAIASALMSFPAFGDSNTAVNGFSFCESALRQLPMVRTDNRIEGRNVLHFLHFGADGKPEVLGDSKNDFVQTNDAGDIQRVGFEVSPHPCTQQLRAAHQCVSPSEAHEEEVSFSYQDGRVKDVTVQHFQDGGWLRDKVTFLPSGDGSSCYVQHVHSDVELVENGQKKDIHSTEFDLETCKLANDVRANPAMLSSVLQAGGMSNIKPCTSNFAQAAMARYYLDHPGSDSSYHQAPAALEQAPDQSQDQPAAQAAAAR
jgi:hypothetical protein